MALIEINSRANKCLVEDIEEELRLWNYFDVI
jgi:hypothetical protein